LAGILLALGIGFRFFNQGAPESPAQPIHFNHKVHADEATCNFCHEYAENYPQAGLPTNAACANCHAMDVFNSVEAQKVTRYIENNEEIPWVRLFVLPDYVYFSHKRHARAQIACEACHEGVGQSVRPVPGIKSHGMDLMNRCLDCHQQKQARRDCFTCHR